MISSALNIAVKQVSSTLSLLNDGATIPFESYFSCGRLRLSTIAENSYNLLIYNLLLPRPVVVIPVSGFSLNSMSSLEATDLDNPVNTT